MCWQQAVSLGLQGCLMPATILRCTHPLESKKATLSMIGFITWHGVRLKLHIHGIRYGRAAYFSVDEIGAGGPEGAGLLLVDLRPEVSAPGADEAHPGGLHGLLVRVEQLQDAEAFRRRRHLIHTKQPSHKRLKHNYK